MELLPKEIQEKIPRLYETETTIPTSEKIIYVRYYAKDTNWVWYAVEYCPEDKIFFGYVQGFTNEWGYFGLKEFEDINKKKQLIIRDESFIPIKFMDLEKLKK